MRCSADLRRRVVEYVRAGGGKAEAAQRFSVGVASVFRWLAMPEVEGWQKPGPRNGHKLDRTRLAAYIDKHPDALLQETAAHFKVSTNAIWYALGRMKISRKKTVGLPRVITASKAPQQVYPDNRSAGSRRS